MPTQQQAFRNLLSSDETFGTTLLVVAIDTYGSQSIIGDEDHRWSPRSLKMELEADFNVEIPKQIFDRLMAAIQVVTSDDFYKRLPVFIQLCNVLSGAEYNPQVFDKADARECAWGMTEAMLLAPPDEDDPEPYIDEIRHYLGKVIDDAGIRGEPPDLLRLAIREKPQAGYSDLAETDPDMFRAEFEVNENVGKVIESELERLLGELFDQLSALPLKNGDTHGLLRRIQKSL